MEIINPQPHDTLIKLSLDEQKSLSPGKTFFAKKGSNGVSVRGILENFGDEECTIQQLKEKINNNIARIKLANEYLKANEKILKELDDMEKTT